MAPYVSPYVVQHVRVWPRHWHPRQGGHQYRVGRVVCAVRRRVFRPSRDRSCCNIVEPVFSSADAMLEDNVVPSVDDDGDDVDVVDAVVSIDVDDDAFDFCVDAGLSPNPLPAAERVVVIVLHDDDAIVGRLDTALLLLGEKCEVVKALVRMIPWLLL